MQLLANIANPAANCERQPLHFHKSLRYQPQTSELGWRSGDFRQNGQMDVTSAHTASACHNLPATAAKKPILCKLLRVRMHAAPQTHQAVLCPQNVKSHVKHCCQKSPRWAREVGGISQPRNPEARRATATKHDNSRTIAQTRLRANDSEHA